MPIHLLYLIIAHKAPVKGVLAIVLVFRNVRSHTLDGKGPILDSVRVPSE